MRTIISFLLSLLFLSSLKAQNSNDSFFVQLEDLVVSANRWQGKAKFNTRQIKLLKREEIEKHSSGTMADLIGSTGAVFIQKSQQGGGSPMLRGFSSNRLLYVVDGVRMNTAIFRSGNLHNIIALDAYALEQTEVLFGANSVIYGSDAIGGVMNFQTLVPKFAKVDRMLIKGRATARYATANKEKVGHLHFNLAKDKWSFLSSLTAYDFGDLRQGARGANEHFLSKFWVERKDNKDVLVHNPNPLVQKPSAYSQINLMHKVAFRPSASLNFNYSFHYSSISTYGRYDRLMSLRGGKPRFAQWDYTPQRWMMHNLALEHRGDKLLYDKLKLQLAYQLFEEGRIERAFAKGLRRTQREKVGAYSLNLDLMKRLKSNVKLYYGLEYVLNRVKSKAIGQDIESLQEQSIQARYPESSWQSSAIYAQSSVNLSPELILELGARYNLYSLRADFSQYDFDFVPELKSKTNLHNGDCSYGLGLVCNLDDDLSLKFNISKGFRAPNVDDIGKVFSSIKGTLTVPNPKLKAECVHNFDLSLSKQFSDVFRFDILAYYTSLDNALLLRPFQFKGKGLINYRGEELEVLAVQNKAKARVYGAELSMSLQALKGLHLLGQVNYQKGIALQEDGHKTPLRHSAPLFGKLALNYQVLRFETKLYTYFQGGLRHQDLAPEERRKTDLYALDNKGQTYVPAWFTLNWQANYRLGKHWLFSLGVENILDRAYRPYSSGISSAGRSLTLSSSYCF